MKVSVFSNVESGVLKRNRKALSEVVQQFNGKEIKITIENKRKTRSNAQNRYYWSCIVGSIKQAIKDCWGENMTSEQVHEMLKHELNFKEKVNESTGEIIKVPKSTTENSTTEMEDYHEDCRKFAKEWFNINIALPNEEMEIEFDN